MFLPKAFSARQVFTDTHLCYSQEATDSCGLASTKMVVFKVNKLRPGHSAFTTEKAVEAIYKKYDATAVNVGSLVLPRR